MPISSLEEERRLPTCLTPDAVLRYGTDGRLTDVSDSVEELLGYTPEQLVGRIAVELIHVDEREAVARAFSSAASFSETFSMQLRVLRHDGSVLRADARVDAVRHAAGSPIEHRVTIRDSSDRRRGEELRAQWEQLFCATRRGIAVTDPRSGVLVAVNPAYAAMHGGTVDDFVGLPVTCVLSVPSAERMAQLGALVDPNGYVAYESEHVRADGSTFPAIVEVMAGRDEAGELLYWLSWIEDLTERRAAEAEVRRHADKLVRSNADLDRFAGVVAHDLQAPLRVIAGCARVLERRAPELLAGDDRELVEHIVSGVQRMSALLDGIRDYSRVREEGDAAARDVPCRQVVDDVLSGLSADLEAAGATVGVGPLPTLRADHVQLAQLFQNLIANAVKFRGHDAPTIAISATPVGETWEFTVADNGLGIDPSDAERVFDFGQRLHSQDQIPGSGIGLTVCKTVVERHGGRIWVVPASAGGSQVHFTLPSRTAQPSR